MKTLLRDFTMSYDPDVQKFAVALKFGGIQIVFYADESKLSGLGQIIQFAIKNKDQAHGNQ